MLYRLYRSQTVAAPLDEVWEYFSKPENLNELTPPDMDFEIVHYATEEMAAGQLIEYRVKFMPIFRSRWLTEIAHVEYQAYFVDEQRVGPYRFWYHEHHFTSVEAGTMITDHVTYALPFGIIGRMVHSLWVRRRLEGIFHYRAEKITQLFGTG